MRCIAPVSAFLLSALLPLGAAEEADLMDADGKPVLHYAVEVPKELPPVGTADPAKQLGLILAYHEHDGHAVDEVKTVMAALQRLNKTDGYVVIGVQHVNHIYTKDDHVHTVELIAWAKQHYAINPRRVYDFGRGEGATMSAEFALEHPDLIACAVTYSWGFRVMPEAKDPETELPSLYVVLGWKDTPTHLPMVRGTYVKAKAHGYHLIYREFDGRGPSVHPPTNDDALTWAIASRSKVLPLAPAETALLKPIADAAAAKAVAADPAIFSGVALVGGPQAGALIGAAFSATSEPARVLAIKSAEAAVYGEPAMAALAKTLDDPSAAVVAAALHALGVNAGWGSAAAQQALAAFATGGGAPAARVQAIDAIGAAVRLQIVGHQQDLTSFKALVAALGDADATVRTHAFAVLEPIRTSAYKPDAPAAERATALADWQTWYDGIVTKDKDPVGPLPPKK